VFTICPPRNYREIFYTPFNDPPEDLNESAQRARILVCAFHFNLKRRHPSSISGFIPGEKGDETRLGKLLTHRRVDPSIDILAQRLCAQPFI
jgi:hypothetical protein